MKQVISIPVLVSMVMAMTSFQATAHEEDVSEPQKNVLYQAALPGVEGMEMTVAHVAVPAGFTGGKHLHPGPVFVYVLEGELTVELEGEIKTFSEGELYPEDINAAMVGKNLSTTDDLKLLIFHVAGEGEPEKIKVD